MNQNYVLPIVIVVTGALIAGAVFWAGKSGTGGNNAGGSQSTRAYTPGKDHILGNPNATVKVIEYADLECRYCKDFHVTMHQIMDYYGKDGNVAWIFRHFPLSQIHSKAPQEAQASECAADQGGDTAFWRYIDKVYEITPSDNGLDLGKLPEIAQEIGLDVAAFNQCLESGKFAQRVAAEYQEAVSGGGQGTPYTFLMVGSESVVLAGSQPYDSMRAAIDALLGNLSTPASQ